MNTKALGRVEEYQLGWKSRNMSLPVEKRIIPLFLLHKTRSAMGLKGLISVLFDIHIGIISLKTSFTNTVYFSRIYET